MSRPVNIRVDVFMAIAHQVRRRIVVMLSKGDRTAGEIARSFSITQPAVSQHLSMLRQARLVTQRRVGRQRVYRLNRTTLKQVGRWVDSCSS